MPPSAALRRLSGVSQEPAASAGSLRGRPAQLESTGWAAPASAGALIQQMRLESQGVLPRIPAPAAGPAQAKLPGTRLLQCLRVDSGGGRQLVAGLPLPGPNQEGSRSAVEAGQSLAEAAAEAHRRVWLWDAAGTARAARDAPGRGYLSNRLVDERSDSSGTSDTLQPLSQDASAQSMDDRAAAGCQVASGGASSAEGESVPSVPTQLRFVRLQQCDGLEASSKAHDRGPVQQQAAAVPEQAAVLPGAEAQQGGKAVGVSGLVVSGLRWVMRQGRSACCTARLTRWQQGKIVPLHQRLTHPRGGCRDCRGLVVLRHIFLLVQIAAGRLQCPGSFSPAQGAPAGCHRPLQPARQLLTGWTATVANSNGRLCQGRHRHQHCQHWDSLLPQWGSLDCDRAGRGGSLAATCPSRSSDRSRCASAGWQKL